MLEEEKMGLADKEFGSLVRKKIAGILLDLSRDDLLPDQQVRLICSGMAEVIAGDEVLMRIASVIPPLDPCPLAVQFGHCARQDPCFFLHVRPDFMHWSDESIAEAKALVLKAGVILNNYYNESASLRDLDFQALTHARGRFWQGFYLAQAIAKRLTNQAWLSKDSRKALEYFRKEHTVATREYW